MAKKDFAKDFANVNTGRVFNAIETATAKKGHQGTASQQEQAERASELRTQGRKGCKAVRINMAFSPQNHEFIKVMARGSGRTMTEFTNLVLDAYRREHPEMMAQARAFLDTLNSGLFFKELEEGRTAEAAPEEATADKE